MKNIKILWSAIVILICLSIELPSLSAKQIPIKVLSKTAEVRDVQISPNGEYFSVIFRKDGQDLLGILDRNTKQPINIFSIKGLKKSIGGVYWINNERIVYTTVESSEYDTTVRNYGELNALNVDGSKRKAIFGYQSGETQTGTNIKKKKNDRAWFDLIDLLEDDDKYILISVLPWQIDFDEVKPEVFKLNVYSGRKKKTGKLPGRWGMTDNNGNLRFSWRVNDDNRLVIYYKEAKLNAPIGDWKTFDVKDFEYQKIFPISFTEDNKSVYLNVTRKNKTSALYLLNIEEQIIEKVYQHDLVDTSDYIFNFNASSIVAVRNDLGKPSYEYLDKKDAMGKLHRILSKAFPNNNVEIVSATKGNSHVVVLVTSDTNSGDYYLFSTKKLNADYIISASPWLDPAEMAKMEPLVFKMRDGATIHGYLTKPKVYKGKLPLVVMPHGGPHGVRDYWGFDYEVQLLANRGYAVLQVNFRGSEGFGLGFEEKGYGEWGALMQDDLTDATLQLINDKIVDKNRICIYGHSYGGYAALMGVVRERSLYKCAIGSMGVYDLPMMFEEGDVADSKSGIAFLKEVLGEDLDVLKQRSPAHNASKIEAEILLIHGDKDNRAPIVQVESMKEALDKIGKSYQYLEFSNEAHGYRDEKNRVKMFNKIFSFLDEHIGENN